MLQALKLAPSYYQKFKADYLTRRDLLVTILKGAGFTCTPPEGTYFVVADYSALKDVDDLTFATW